MKITCTLCPNGCSLVVKSSKEGLTVSGNRCPRGEQYGRDEYTDPRRVITAAVRTTDPEIRCAPVKSDRPIPKAEIQNVLKTLYARRVPLPVTRGDICIANCCPSGASLVYTRTLKPSGEQSH